MWLKIHKSFVKTENDSKILSSLIKKYKANFNTHDERSMWFNFESISCLTDFAKGIIQKMPYLKITIGT